jgi:hypothetical protein
LLSVLHCIEERNIENSITERHKDFNVFHLKDKLRFLKNKHPFDKGNPLIEIESVTHPNAGLYILTLRSFCHSWKRQVP